MTDANQVQESLAPPEQASMSAKAVPIVLEALDRTTEEVVRQLDELIEEIQAVKNIIINRTQQMKAESEHHFAFGAEAIGFANLVRNRLSSVAAQTSNKDTG